MRISRLSALLVLSVILLTVSPVSASPTLSLGSSSSYQLDASFRRVDSCTSENFTIAAIVCGSTTSFQTNVFVSVNDDFLCNSATDSLCSFNPNNVTLSVSGTATWGHGSGTLNHTVTSDTGLFNFKVPNRFNFSAPPTSFTFQSAGTFSYHCTFHPWMKGQVVVIQPVPLPPTIQSFSLNGPVGWTVVGLDENAQLELNHKITAYNSSASPPVRLYNESGVSPETIELSTREDSPSGVNPLGFLYNLPFPFQGFLPVSPGFGYFPYAPFESYTVWWVNGPLRLGSTLEVLTFRSAVRGGETVDLGTGLGTQGAWVVSYLNSEAFNQTKPTSQTNSYYCYSYPPYPYIGFFPGPSPGPFPPTPSPVCYTSGSSNALSLKLDYGQRSDLLFALNATLDNYSQTTTVYPAGSYVYGYGFPYGFSIRVSSQVSVVRTSRYTSYTSLKLASTSLDLSSRTIPPASSEGPNSNLASSIASFWMYGTVSVFAAGLVGAGVWIASRARRKGKLIPNLENSVEKMN